MTLEFMEWKSSVKAQLAIRDQPGLLVQPDRQMHGVIKSVILETSQYPPKQVSLGARVPLTSTGGQMGK
jgi:hypothetical protein